MIVVITDNTIRGARSEYLALGKAFAADALKSDHGCLFMEVCIDEARPDHVIFVSHWETKADWDAHVGGETFRRHIPAMGPYYAGGVDTILTVQ